MVSRLALYRPAFWKWENIVQALKFGPRLKDGESLRETSRLNSEVINKEFAVLNIRECTVNDAGQYSIALTNRAGKKVTPVEVVVFDRPSNPKNLVYEDVTSSSVAMKWDAPLYTGGVAISNYILEKRDATSTVWTTVSSTLARSSV